MIKTAEIDRHRSYASRPANGRGAAASFVATLLIHALVVGALAVITFNVTPPKKYKPVEATFTSPPPTTRVDPAAVESVAKRKPQLPRDATKLQPHVLPYVPTKLPLTEVADAPIDELADQAFGGELLPPAKNPAAKKPPVKTTPRQAPPTRITNRESAPRTKKPVFAQARVRSTARAQYPESARRKGTEGVTHVRLSVSATGKVSAASVSKSSGNSSLDAAAVKAASKWKFYPAKSGGRAVATTVVVPIRFSLS